jgi:hypothetical protein
MGFDPDKRRAIIETVTTITQSVDLDQRFDTIFLSKKEELENMAHDFYNDWSPEKERK